ncbi:MAG: hypothetical protein ACPHDL_13590, partial [Limisphaerales bacterium]
IRKLLQFLMDTRASAQSSEGLNRSKLVGMYLSRTNHNSALSVEMQRTRQRRNGKYASKRERL